MLRWWSHGRLCRRAGPGDALWRVWRARGWIGFLVGCCDLVGVRFGELRSGPMVDSRVVCCVWNEFFELLLEVICWRQVTCGSWFNWQVVRPGVGMESGISLSCEVRMERWEVVQNYWELIVLEGLMLRRVAGGEEVWNVDLWNQFYILGHQFQAFYLIDGLQVLNGINLNVLYSIWVGTHVSDVWVGQVRWGQRWCLDLLWNNFLLRCWIDVLWIVHWLFLNVCIWTFERLVAGGVWIWDNVQILFWVMDVFLNNLLRIHVFLVVQVLEEWD